MKPAVALFAAIAAFAPFAAAAQADFPNRGIKIIAPIPAGSAADVLARIYAEGLQKKWGQPVVIENRVGAAHNIGADAFSRAAPDGYTLLTAPPPSLAINQYLYPKITYDATQFVPVTIIAEVPNVLVVRPGLGVKTVAELIALAKSKPGQITFGTTGVGSTLHLSAEAFKSGAGIDLLHVPYTGVNQVISEMVAGRIDMAFMNLIDCYGYISKGPLIPLAVGLATPSPELPNVPPLADTLPGYYATAWFAVAAPAKTPMPIVEKLADGIRDTFKTPEGATALANLHAAPVLGSPAETAAFIKADSARWKAVIEKNHIQGE